VKHKNSDYNFIEQLNVHNNLSITASTYNRRSYFVFRGLDFSEILSIFIKPSRKANILKEVLL